MEVGLDKLWWGIVHVVVNLVIEEIPRSMRCKNKEKNICKENNYTRQYIRGSAICLHLQSCSDFTIYMEKYKMQ